MTCQKCGSMNIIPDVERDGCTKRPYLKCLMCGQEYKGEKAPEETENSTIQEFLKNDNPEINECVNPANNISKESTQPLEGDVLTEEKEQIVELSNLRNLANCPECLSGNEKEKEVVMEEQKTLKGTHKPCKNHPEKYAVKEGLCQYKPITAEIIATKICEIWQVKDGEATAEIIFKGNEFDSCEVAGIPGHFKLDDWLFIGKVAREIERLAGER